MAEVQNTTEMNFTLFDNGTTISLMPTTPTGLAEAEHKTSMAIFFILSLIIISIMLVHILIKYGVRVVPDSLAIALLGSVVGLGLSFTGLDFSNEETFSPNAFFLFLLPPIIFESGYNLNKGNFFTNAGSILVFAIFGTLISAFIIGGSIYVLGEADLVYKLSAIDSFAFGSLISAVDPVATLAIFQALNVDPVLHMLVFGESVLNDALAIVLYTTVMELKLPSVVEMDLLSKLINGVGRFCLMFFASALIGVLAALILALMLKHIDLRKTPSLEFALLLIFAYLPYGLAEGLHLSGIMAILFCGIVMSHYCHLSLSPMTQVTMQQTARTLAFIAETCVFIYLGIACFSFNLIWSPALILWSIALCMVARAANIFPLSFCLNYVRTHKITKNNQFIMWFSGLRGAVAFALALHMEFEDPKTRAVVVTCVLCIVLFTTIVFGGGTLPLVQLLERCQLKKLKERDRRQRTSRSRRSRSLRLSKTEKLDHVRMSELEEDNKTLFGPGEPSAETIPGRLKGLLRLDALYFKPFFVRKFTLEEKREDTVKLTEFAFRWYNEILATSDVEEPQASEDEDVLLDRSTEAKPLVPTK